MKRRIEIIVGLLALVTALWSGLSWITTHAVRARTLTETVERHSEEIETLQGHVRAVGALQIQQGDDQRHILLDMASPEVRLKHRTKPPELVAAERRVLE